MTTKNVPQLVLQQVEKFGTVESNVLAAALEVDHQVIVGAIKSLQCVEGLINVDLKTITSWELTAEGKEVVEGGSYEYNLFMALPEEGILQSTLMDLVPNSKFGFSKAMANKWIKVDRTVDPPLIKKSVENIKDDIKNLLISVECDIKSVEAKTLNILKKRKFVQLISTKSYSITKGTNFHLNIEKHETDLTSEMLNNDSWKTKTFKEYNYNSLGKVLSSGHLHPLLKVRSAYRDIFLEMGFSEMPTNNFVESSFWNFDSLFQPQQHPARDAHDTFFLKDPATSNNFTKEYMEKVKKVHSEGGFGSQGYGYDWKISEAQKNILRTHTTAVSARMLYNIAKQKPFKPIKLFSIDRVFRNETLDSTHLAEFHQVEGVVADDTVTLGDLMGILEAFFRKLGIERLRFKPAYNPYTEPSMEIFGYHPGLKKWVEIGNSGVFRPEMLRPMGLPEDVNVIAWGLSLERPTMIKLGINNIRDLCGHKIDLQMVYDSPICQMDI